MKKVILFAACLFTLSTAVNAQETARKPKTRYPVGGDAKMQAIIGKYFPDFLKDWMIKQKLKKFGYK